MKKILTIFMILIVTLSSLTAVTQSSVNMITSFTFSTSCIIGFSKRDVVDCSPLPETQRYTNASILDAKFDAKTNSYVTDVFYAYCQAFSQTPLTVMVYAPLKMRLEPDNPSDRISYSIITPEGGTATGTWEVKIPPLKTAKHNCLEVKEASTDGSARVLLSQPIQISIPSANVPYGKIYYLTMTMELIAP